MTYFHPEEEFQFGVLEEYNDNHPGTRYLVEFPDGESYVCRYFASYESENNGELDIEMDDPRYDEFYQVAMDIVETVRTGVRCYQDGFTLDYRDSTAQDLNDAARLVDNLDNIHFYQRTMVCRER